MAKKKASDKKRPLPAESKKKDGDGGSSKSKKKKTVGTTTTESATIPPPPPPTDWKVVRLAAKDKATRTKQGGDMKSKQLKEACATLEILEDGVTGTTAPWFFFFTKTIVDYNHYRNSEQFEGKPKDRVVSVATVAAYQELQQALDSTGKIALVQQGDLGENILLDGPPAVATKKNGGGLYVGAQIKLGTAVLEITEANTPCYRFNTQDWAEHAKSLWGETAPEGMAGKWFQSPDCPLNHEVKPGIRGWLAKVVQEGHVKLQDEASLVVTEPEAAEEDADKGKAKVEKKKKKKATPATKSSPPRATKKSRKKK